MPPAASTSETRDLSPSGKRAVLEYRGEIVTVPAKKGDTRNLTQTPGAHERSPVWSPDGKSIAYFSDDSGEYQLVVRPQDGKGSGRILSDRGAPASMRPGVVARQQEDRVHRQLAHPLLDRPRHRANQANRRRADLRTDPDYSHQVLWSPDSKWLAYTLTNRAGFQTIQLYAIDADKSHALTDGLVEARRAGLRLRRQVSLLPGLDRRRSGQELV